MKILHGTRLYYLVDLHRIIWMCSTWPVSPSVKGKMSGPLYSPGTEQKTRRLSPYVSVEETMQYQACVKRGQAIDAAGEEWTKYQTLYKINFGTVKSHMN